jgi:hypothetical protein
MNELAPRAERREVPVQGSIPAVALGLDQCFWKLPEGTVGTAPMRRLVVRNRS